MNSAFLHVVTAKGSVNVPIELENMPVIGEGITEETKKEIAYEVLKKMKEKKLIRYFTYTEESVDENLPDRTIDLV